MSKEQQREKPEAAKEPEYPEHTTGSELAREAREQANNLSEEQREELFRRGMQLIYGGDPQTATVSPRR